MMRQQPIMKQRNKKGPALFAFRSFMRRKEFIEGESKGLALSDGEFYRTGVEGFTLLELLVVAVILTLLSVVIAQVFISTMRSNNKTETLRDVKANGDRALEIITRLVQNAESIQIPSFCPERPEIGETLDEVKLTNADGGETTLQCLVDGDVARIASTSVSQTVYLTNTNVTLFDPIEETNACTNHALSFTCSSVGDTPSYITVSFPLRQKDSSASVIDSGSATFQTTVTLRNK